MSRKRFSTGTAPHTMGPVLTYQEAASRCFAAARMALKGEKWGHTSQVDCAADVLTDVLSATLPTARTGRPADVLRWVAFCERFPTAARRYAEGIPAAALSFTRLYGMASNWRRAEVSRRERTDKVSLTAAVAGMMEQSREPGEPGTARATAVELLDGLGLARLGKLYPVAYAAARESDGLTGDEIADELSMAPATLRKQISRAASKVPSSNVHGYREHAEALRIDEHRPAGKRQNGLLNPGGTDSNEWRGNGAQTPDAGPLTITHVEPQTTAWDGSQTAQWANGLRPSTAARLAHAARLQRDRSAALSPADRTAKRLAAGLPA